MEESELLSVGLLILEHELQYSSLYSSHLLVFTFTPLLMSIIFWAVNGETKIAYIDSLFLSYSAFTGTGLQAVDLSSTTPLQQAILWILMFSGSPIVASWVMVYIRKSVPITLALAAFSLIAIQKSSRKVLQG